jgi:hypothetical protein
MFSTLILLLLPIEFSAKIFVVEAIALTFFGVSWLVKGQIFGLLADKPACCTAASPTEVSIDATSETSTEASSDAGDNQDVGC